MLALPVRVSPLITSTREAMLAGLCLALAALHGKDIAASAIVGSRVKSEWEMKFTLAQKDAETAQRAASMEIASLKEANTKQAQALQAL